MRAGVVWLGLVVPFDGGVDGSPAVVTGGEPVGVAVAAGGDGDTDVDRVGAVVAGEDAGGGVLCSWLVLVDGDPGRTGTESPRLSRTDTSAITTTAAAAAAMSTT